MDTVIVVIFVAIAVWYVGRRVYRQLKGVNSCSCEGGCANCDKTLVEPSCPSPDEKDTP